MSDHNALEFGSVGEYIQARQDELGTTDEQIMLYVGLPNERHVKLIKQGLTPMPVYKAVELAEVLEADPAAVLGLILTQNDPALLDVIERAMGPLSLSEGEVKLLNTLRDLAKDRDPIPIVLGKDFAVLIVGPELPTRLV